MERERERGARLLRPRPQQSQHPTDPGKAQGLVQCTAMKPACNAMKPALKPAYPDLGKAGLTSARGIGASAASTGAGILGTQWGGQVDHERAGEMTTGARERHVVAASKRGTAARKRDTPTRQQARGAAAELTATQEWASQRLGVSLTATRSGPHSDSEWASQRLGVSLTATRSGPHSDSE
jgi:hypothetical protein